MPIPEDFAQITWGFTGSAVPTGAACTMGVRVLEYSGSPADLASSAATIWENRINGAIVNTCVLSSVLVKFGPDATGPSAQIGTSQAGNVATPGGAAAPSFLIHKNTDSGGRAGKGRMFVPGVPEASVDVGGALQAGLATGLTAAFQSLLADFIALDAEPVVLHGLGSPLNQPSFITSFTCDPIVGTQRRRQRR